MGYREWLANIGLRFGPAPTRMGGRPGPSFSEVAPKDDPPEWFKKIYGDYLKSDEGRRLYGKPEKN